jgi:hypothetical protein
MSALQIVAVKIDHTKVAPFSNFLYFTLWDKVSKEHLPAYTFSPEVLKVTVVSVTISKNPLEGNWNEESKKGSLLCSFNRADRCICLFGLSARLLLYGET